MLPYIKGLVQNYHHVLIVMLFQTRWLACTNVDFLKMFFMLLFSLLEDYAMNRGWDAPKRTIEVVYMIIYLT